MLSDKACIDNGASSSLQTFFFNCNKSNEGLFGILYYFAAGLYEQYTEFSVN